jgi:hypothetical protein
MRCPICGSPMRWEGQVLRCTVCGWGLFFFVYGPQPLWPPRDQGVVGEKEG